jgi:hypothetical protein
MIKKILVFIFLLSLTLFAQESQSTDRAAQFVVGRPDQLLINVHVWGFVQRPGNYTIPTTYDLLTLISLAGGPAAQAQLSVVKIVRGATEEGEKEKVILVDLDHFLRTGERSNIPQLMDKDTVILPGKTTSVIPNALAMLRDMGILLITFYQIRNFK